MAPAEPPWLDDAQQDAWLQLAGLLHRLPTALDAQLQRDAGLTLFEYATLSRLSEAPDRTMRMGALAVSTSASLSRLSHVVTRLEKRGLVRRVACPGDKRATNAVLTDDGWDKVVASAPGHVAEVRRLVVEPLSPTTLCQLGAAGRGILSALDADAAQAPRAG